MMTGPGRDISPEARAMRRTSPITAFALLASLGPLAAHAQTPPGPAAPQTARVETAPLELTAPDRYQVPVVFEPDRHVALKATDDGIVLALPARVGEMVKTRQELGRLDMAEAMARLKIATAEVKERMPAAQPANPVAQAQLEAAQARQELAQLAVERCSLKAPFDGLLLDYPVSVGQYVPKGTTVADLADVARLRVRLPIDRSTAKLGDTVPLEIAGASVPGKVEAILPLPESYAPLRELAINWAAALVVVENPDGRTYLPGQRVRAPMIPSQAVTIVPTRALLPGESVQVLRNEHVAAVPVRVLGALATDRTQVTGAFRSGDLVIVASSVPLVEGTFLRFGDATGPRDGLELLPPDPQARGRAAEVQPAPATSVAPIGRPDSAAPRRATTPTPATRPGMTTPKAAPGGASPF
jgi:multidrug efflux pump subunit AcrA (membrane-fusion protein)